MLTEGDDHKIDVMTAVRRVVLATCLLLFAGPLVTPDAQEPAARRKGYVVVPETGGTSAVALQPDGGFVLGGIQRRGGGADDLKVIVIRISADGRLDTRFNGSGVVTTTIGEVSDVLRGLAVQPDGGILVAAHSTRGRDKVHGRPQFFSLVRYTAGGRPDAAFGDGGKIFTQLSRFHLSKPAVLSLKADGKILVAGSALTYRFTPLPPERRWDYAVTQYLPTGELDETFGTRGVAAHALEGFASDMALQADGKIVILGSDGIGYPADIALLRLHPDGSRDRRFGNGGTVITPWREGAAASSMVIQSDGKILVAANRIVLRFEADGRLDSSFGNAGIMPVTFARHVTHVALQPDGRVLLGDGMSRLARFLPDWRPDPSFGHAGVATVAVGGNFRFARPIVQPDGKILLGGSRVVAETRRFAAARCNSDGTLDLTFGDAE